MIVSHTSQASSRRRNHLAEDAALDCRMKIPQRAPGDFFLSAFADPPRPSAVPRLLFEIGLVVAGPRGEVFEQPDDRRIELLLEHRQQVRPHLVARETRIQIRRVEPEIQLPGAKLRLDLSAREVQKGPHHASLERRIDPTQAASARAAQEPEQHGLRLVARGVRGRYFVKASLVHQTEEELVPKVPRRGFHVPARFAGRAGNIGAPSEELDAARARQFLHETFVCVRLGAPQVVVEMDCGQPETALQGEPRHEVEQQYRIAPARNRYPNPLAGSEQSAPRHFERPLRVNLGFPSHGFKATTHILPVVLLSLCDFAPWRDDFLGIERAITRRRKGAKQ